MVGRKAPVDGWATVMPRREASSGGAPRSGFESGLCAAAPFQSPMAASSEGICSSRMSSMVSAMVLGRLPPALPSARCTSEAPAERAV